MDIEISLKNEIYQAVGFTFSILALTFPLSILGIKLLNFVLGQIQL